MAIIVNCTKPWLKPIFHQNTKLLALGTFASANAKDSTFALPNAKNTNMLVSLALGDANFLRRPCTFLFFCVDFIPVEYRWRWVPGFGSLRWACTFHASGDANSTQRNPVIWWNMGLRIDNGDLEHMCTWLGDFSDILVIYQSIWT